MSPRAPLQHQNSQTIQFANPGFVVSSGLTGPATAVQGARSEQCDQQAKNSVFSNALSSPIRRSLQNYQVPQEGYYQTAGPPSANGTRNNDANFVQNQNRDPHPVSSNDSSMDI